MCEVLILNQYPVHDPKADVLFDLALNKIVVDENGKPFDNWLFANIVGDPIHEDDSKSITEPQFRKAFDFNDLKDIIKEHEPKTIIALGSKACKLLTGEKTLKNGIKKEHELLPEFNHECTVYVNYAPKYVVDNPAMKTDFLELFDRALNGIKVKTTPFSVIETIEQLAEVLQDCMDAGIIVFDFETNGLDYWSEDTKPTCLSITYQAGYSHVLPLYHEESHWKPGDFKVIWKLLKMVMLDPKTIKVNHNIKFDLHWIFRFCTKIIRGRVVDTMLMHHLLDENSKHGLKDITAVIFPHCDGYEIKPDDWGKVPFKTLLPYAATDTDNTFKFFVHFENELIEDDDDHKLYVILRNQTMPGMMTMLRAEHRGALVDRGFIEESIIFAQGVLDKLSNELLSFKEVKRFEKYQRELKEEKLIAEIEEKMKTSKAAQYAKYEEKLIKIRSGELQVYEGINLASTQQLGDLLFEKEGFGLPLYKEPYTKKLIKTTDKNALATYLPHPFIEALTQHRSVAKMISTYYKGILEKLDENDYLHSSFLLHGTTTGRLSCIAAGSMIETDKGLIAIETLCPAEYGVQVVEGIKARTHTGKLQDITRGINKGLEMMYEVTLDNGKTIKCTQEHKFFYKSLRMGAETVNNSPLKEIRKMRYCPILTYGDDYVQKIATIVSVKPIGEQVVYDISVAEDASYLAQGFVNHNSREPNLQNIPARTKKGDPDFVDVFKRIKKFFIAPEGYTLIQADFKQAELRIIASVANDPTMIAAYNSGIDMHTVTAARIANMTLEHFLEQPKEFRSEYRTIAKSANFGYVYGATIDTYIQYVKDQTGETISKKTAQDHRDAIFVTYPELTIWHEKAKKTIRKYGYIRTLFGRKRRLPGIYSEVDRVVGEAERAGINSRIQGTSGEWTLFALTLLDTILSDDIFFFNNVHDAGYFYVPNHKVDFTIKIIKELASYPPLKEYFDMKPVAVPMELDFEISTKSWGAVESYVEYAEEGK